jgi:hypothetical protein
LAKLSDPPAGASPRLPDVVVTARVRPQTKAALKAVASKRRKKLGSLLGELLDDLAKFMA